MLPFFLLQRWAQLAGDAGLLDKSSIVATTSLGGDFGFSGGFADIFAKSKIQRGQQARVQRLVDAAGESVVDAPRPALR